MITHPRSLARPNPLWRPPTYRLPGNAHTPQEYVASVSRYRVGPRVRAQVRQSGTPTEAAYLIRLRITHLRGEAVSSHLAASWAHRVAGSARGEEVQAVWHNEYAATFYWVVNGAFEVLPAPPALFEMTLHAA